MPDHVHLFVRVGPTDAPAAVVRAFKGRTARVLRAEFPYLRRFAKVLWSPSYFAASVGLCLGVDGAPLHRAPVGCGGVVRRAYVFRLRPTARQHVALAACVDAHRELYNAALQERRDALVAQQDPDHLRGSVGAAERYPVGASGSGGVVVFQSAGHAAAVEQGVCRVLPPGQSGQTPGYPRFKGKARFDSVEWPKDGDGARWLPEHPAGVSAGHRPGQGQRAPCRCGAG